MLREALNRKKYIIIVLICLVFGAFILCKHNEVTYSADEILVEGIVVHENERCIVLSKKDGTGFGRDYFVDYKINNVQNVITNMKIESERLYSKQNKTITISIPESIERIEYVGNGPDGSAILWDASADLDD